MKTETFENADAVFDRFYSVDHNNNYNNNDNKKMTPARQDQMVVWVFIRICISLETKSTRFYFARDVFGLPRII